MRDKRIGVFLLKLNVIFLVKHRDDRLNVVNVGRLNHAALQIQIQSFRKIHSPHFPFFLFFTGAFFAVSTGMYRSPNSLSVSARQS